MRNRIPKGFNDLIVGLFLVLFIGVASVSAIEGGRNIAARAKCASNLHQIGLAILLYQNDNSQLYPRTVMDTTGSPKPTWGTPYETSKDLGPLANVEPFTAGKAFPAANDVTAALFLLMRNEQITSGVFICPETKLKAWDFGGGAHTAQDWTNWQGNDGLAKHLSYSYQNVYPSNNAIAAGFQIKNPDATFAIASDMNPGGDAVTSVTLKSTEKEMMAANSLNHGGAGQNVLFGDGHAEWMTNPFCGSQHDNIFAAAGPEIQGPDRKTAVLNASPVDSMDSILLPTAADIGYKGAVPGKPMAAADIAKLKTDILGTYTSTFPGGHNATLVVDAKTLKCSIGPITLLFNYEVTSGDEEGLHLNLTAPDTKETAIVSMDGKDLKVQMSGEFALPENPWHRSDAK